jgi:chromosome segregation ATPase
MASEAPKMSTAEAKDHITALVTKFAKPLLHLDTILEAAVTAEQESKTKNAEIKSLNGRLADARTQIERLNGRIRESQDALTGELARVEVAIREAKAKQVEAEAQATAAIAAIETKSLQRQQALDQAHKEQEDKLKDAIASLTQQKREIEAYIAQYHARFQAP